MNDHFVWNWKELRIKRVNLWVTHFSSIRLVFETFNSATQKKRYNFYHFVFIKVLWWYQLISIKYINVRNTYNECPNIVLVEFIVWMCFLALNWIGFASANWILINYEREIVGKVLMTFLHNLFWKITADFKLNSMACKSGIKLL